MKELHFTAIVCLYQCLYTIIERIRERYSRLYIYISSPDIDIVLTHIPLIYNIIKEPPTSCETYLKSLIAGRDGGGMIEVNGWLR